MTLSVRKSFQTDLNLRRRILTSRALKSFVFHTLPFDEAKRKSETAQRNDVRRHAHLPLLDVTRELAHSKIANERRHSSDAFYTLSSAIILELYGTLSEDDFNGISDMAVFFGPPSCGSARHPEE